MPDISRPAGTAAPVARRVGRGFIVLYALAYIGTILLFLAPLLVSLALKVNSLVGIERAPNSLALVTGTGALLAMFANPFFFYPDTWGFGLPVIYGIWILTVLLLYPACRWFAGVKERRRDLWWLGYL